MSMAPDIEAPVDDALEPLLLTPEETADVLRWSQRSLWAATRRGDIPHRKLGRLVRYSLEDLRAWVAAGCPLGDEKGGGSDGTTP
ncbi:MAG: helix-turn-helix domain-containing protein [Phycisphaerales bacterium JB060]